MTECNSLRVAFAGTPEFAREALAELLASSHQVVGVLTQPDRPSGRGRKLNASAVKKLALENGLPIDQPNSLKTAGATDTLASWNADVLVVAAYGILLPKQVLALPPLGCLNIHGSLLPRWRGAAPIHRAVMAGDSETGVTIMQMDEGLDTGAALMHLRVPIQPTDSTPLIHDILANKGAKALVEVLPLWCRGDIEAVPQSAEGVTYAHKLDKSEAKIDFSQSAILCDRTIRGLAGWPIAESTLDGERIRLHGSTLSTTAVPKGTPPGTIINTDQTAITVATGDGAVDLLRLQRPGKKALDAADFASGLTLVGRVFRG